MNLFKVRVFEYPIALLSAFLSFSISIFYLVFFIIPSSPWQSLKLSKINFRDDRDLWLQFASAFPDSVREDTLNWQLNFWPPGNIAVLTLGHYLFGSLLAAALFHVLLLSLTQAVLTYQCASLFRETKRSRFIIFLIVFLYHVSFIYRSSFIDAALLSDYLASSLMCLACVWFYKAVVLRNPSPSDFICLSLLVVVSGYIRITSYQIVMFGFLLSLSIFLLLKLMRRAISIKLVSTLIVFTISFLLFFPWIAIRSIAIYDNNFVKGAQFSAQAQFALQHQWDTPKDIAMAPQLGLMGLGTACKIDPKTCTLLSDRLEALVAGDLPTTMDNEMDLRARKAIVTFITHPLKWIQIKLEYLPQAYFQKSVYDSIDSKIHYSWDLILVLMLLPFNLTQIIRKRRTESAKFLGLVQITSIALGAQLLLTQTLLRFFLPSILLTILVTVLVISVIELPSDETTIGQETGVK